MVDQGQEALVAEEVRLNWNNGNKILRPPFTPLSNISYSLTDPFFAPLYTLGRDTMDADDHSDHDRDERSRKEGSEAAQEPEKALEELTPEEQEARMMAMMGFGGFDSTKGKKVAGANVSGADIKQQRTYRQYMNRRGGFNR